MTRLFCAFAFAFSAIVTPPHAHAQTNIQPGVIDQRPQDLEIPRGYEIEERDDEGKLIRSLPPRPVAPNQIQQPQAQPEIPAQTRNVLVGAYDPAADTSELLIPALRKIKLKGKVELQKHDFFTTIAPFVNAPMTEFRMEMLVQALTNKYFSLGMPRKRVYVPEQKFTDGVLILTIYESESELAIRQVDQIVMESAELEGYQADASSGIITDQGIVGRREPQFNIILQDVRLNGVTALKEKKIYKKVIKPYLGKNFSDQDLAMLKYRVSSMYYDKGFSLVHIATPPQDLSDGIIDVNVYESRLYKITVHQDEQDVVHPYVAQTIAKRLKSGQVFREQWVESMASDLNDLEDVESYVNLTPGDKFGTTNLDVYITEKRNEKPNYVEINNHGNDLVGDIVASMHLEHGNLLGIGEKYTLDVQRSDGRLWGYNAGFQTPIGFRNVKLNASYGETHSELGGRFLGLQSSGETESSRVSLSSKLINTQNTVFQLEGGMEIRKHTSELAGVADTEDNIRKGFATASFLNRGPSHVLFTALTVSKGLDLFGASDFGEADASRARGRHKTYLAQPILVFNYRPPVAFFKNGVIKTRASGQISSHTVLASDLYTLGGYGEVRGFSPAEETGESGYQFSVEYNHDIRFLLPDWNLKFGPFVDGGTVYNRVQGQTEDRNLYSAGVGLEMSPQIPRLGDTLLRFDFASTLGNYSSNDIYAETFYFKVRQGF